ncbi:MAG: hypothetical protein Tsb0013_13130 [Phycisphaerales bacterium]
MLCIGAFDAVHERVSFSDPHVIGRRHDLPFHIEARTTSAPVAAVDPDMSSEKIPRMGGLPTAI